MDKEKKESVLKNEHGVHDMTNPSALRAPHPNLGEEFDSVLKNANEVHDEGYFLIKEPIIKPRRVVYGLG